MIKLICDLNIHLRGHNAGFAQYVVDHIKVSEAGEVFFLFNKQARDILDISGSAVQSDHFLFTEEDFKQESALEKFKFAEWKTIEKFAGILKIDELFLMDLTRYEIQLGMSRVPFRISGIEFRPSHRINVTEGSTFTKFTAIIQRYKRRFFESIILRCKALDAIFILNDPSGVEELNARYKTRVFKHLVDPIFDYGYMNNRTQSDMKLIHTQKIVFIIFGSLDWRKNFKNIFAAFNQLDQDIQRDITLLIVGKMPGYYQEEFQSLLSGFTRLSPHIDLVLVDEFVSDSQMEYYFSVSDVSLVVYSKFYGSSALLGRAAKHNVISLVPSVGLMAELCNTYQLGYLCNPNLPEDIGEKIHRAYQDVKMKQWIDGGAFYQSHSPEVFLEMLDL